MEKIQITEGAEATNEKKKIIIIRKIWEKENYKYLGILETDTIKWVEMKKQ